MVPAVSQPPGLRASEPRNRPSAASVDDDRGTHWFGSGVEARIHPKMILTKYSAGLSQFAMADAVRKVLAKLRFRKTCQDWLDVANAGYREAELGGFLDIAPVAPFDAVILEGEAQAIRVGDADEKASPAPRAHVVDRWR
jgi:hypothetical protein